MMKKEQVHIITATNDKYAKPLGVMLNSLLKNATYKSMIRIYIIDGDLSSEKKKNLKRVVKKFNLDVKFLKVNSSLFDGFKERHHISRQAYYRIVIPHLLDKDIKKVLYMDCDIIVKEDIRKLWNTNIDNHFLAAGEKAFAKNDETRKSILQLPSEARFFNSGVLLINPEKWREHDISNKVLEFITTNSNDLITMDQEALNVVLHDKWLKLDTKWNYSTSHIKTHPGVKPAIIHYTRRRKPWNHGHPLQKEYFNYLKTTGWSINRTKKKE
ncbi:glycosyltransferase family 8 protein [Paenibacillus sedimenti]|uniref:Glycosyltransferase family 8 protein n=1 Tax=Paenibacillus sedimenti TaxID=2770274 RepID=A0A926KRI6_9BACL|nr:glycosyltransferase family 8 protein [Paenibacillus sedimenti]MBD0381576.1 glycosyltransferase family 8 protein [Paenibacillus sedimenti]